ncbi:SDR family NAD(P)-dependent oxidoreductase [Streptomyces sp. WM6386]|uniref:SDR family NAD(P)-dependent oxidoreductase n=1 Tax=Streptomyces sp. WM6386 TaxID=1415558 RepID=UPI0006197354|nr:glucose 1-dehydrogenase [Streptomyces sp. WM6386]KKD06649.1 short-chain dehydrogenase [Streptomyces sp. WM6386]
MAELENKVAIVTGGASGVGAATAHVLSREGAAVVVADINAGGAEAVAKRIEAAGGRAVAAAVDVTEDDQVAAMVATAVREFGRLDVLHNNAFLGSPDVMARDAAITDIDPDLWDRVLRVNLRGYALGAKHAIPAMLADGGGVIVNTTSGTGLLGESSRPAYGTSKAAIVGLTRNIAAQYGKQGIRSVAVALGLVATEALKANLPGPAQEMMLTHHLTTRLAEPEDIAEVVSFLASDRAAFITGCTIPVDGGFTSHTASYADERRFTEAAG